MIQRKILLSALLVVTLFTMLTPMPATAKETVTAVPVSFPIVIDDTALNFHAYAINGTTYLKLRDFAYSMTNESKRGCMSVALWAAGTADEYIAIYAFDKYVPVGGEMESKGPGNKTAVSASYRVSCDFSGVTTFYDFSIYTIEGNNYFQLREIAKRLNIRVSWSDASKSVIVDTQKTYLEPGVEAISIGGLTHGMTLSDAEKILGTPYLIFDDPGVGLANGQNRLYGDYSNFTLLVVGDNATTALPEVIGIYANHDIPDVDGPDYSRRSDYEDNYYAVQVGRVAQGNSTLDTVEPLFMEYLNAYRMKVRGIKPLVWNEELAVTARAHSEYMGHGGGVTHNPAPDGSDTIRIDYWENVTNVSGGAQGSFEVWAESNGHHNILFVGDEGAVGFSGGYATFRTFDTD